MSERREHIRVLELFGEPISSGGQESVVSNFVSHMDMDGLRIDYLTPYRCESAQHAKVVEDRGGEVFSLGEEFRPGSSRFHLAEPLRRFFADHPYDVVHVHSGSTTFLAVAAKAAKRSGAKRVIVHSHCGADRLGLKGRLVRRVADMMMRSQVDVYCSCSQEASEAKFVPAIQRRVLSLNNGIDLQRFAPDPSARESMREQLGFSDDELVVGHVGRFAHQKNHEFLLAILSELLERDERAMLLLVGDGELKEDVEKRIREAGLQGNVVMAGSVDNVEDYLQAMDVFVLSSRYEGLPVVLVEAQAAGLPVIVSDAITSQALVADDAVRLSLDDPPALWAERVLAAHARGRSDDIEALAAAGFDAAATARRIRDLYRGAVE